jgi:PAS domain S-box-containing protein
MRRNGALASFEEDFDMRRQGLTPDAEIMLRLQQISTLLISEGTNGAIYERVLDAAIDLMSAHKGSMQVFHPERGELRLLVQRGFDPQVAGRWEWVRYDFATTCSMALLTGSRVIVPDFETCETMAGTADLDAFRQSDVRAAQSTPLMSRSGRLLGMVTTYWRNPHRLTDRELQPLDVLARQAADLIERNEAEAALRESREQFRWLASIVECSDDAIVSKNLDGIITSWNRGAERVFGYLAEEAIGKPITILIPPERHHEAGVILQRIRRGDRVDQYETIQRRKDGSLIDISLTASPVRGADGKVVGASVIARDITERKRSEEREHLLMREVNHRAKNMLSVVDAIARQTATRDPEHFVERFSERIQALSANQDLLIQNAWHGVEIEELVRAQLAPFADLLGSRIALSGSKLRLNAAAAQAIGLALHELSTNAGKYGALSKETGRLEIRWWTDGETFTMCWTECEGPPVSAPQRCGFGTVVIQGMAESSLNGKVDLEHAPSGVIWRLTCPAVNAQEPQRM